MAPKNAPGLQRPGAGLPALEGFFLRHLLFPLYSRMVSIEKAVNSFEHTSRRIAMLVDNRPLRVQHTRVLVPRLTGMEDASRYWSPLQVMEHLILVTDSTTLLASALACDEKPKIKIRMTALKPTGVLEKQEKPVEIFHQHMTRAVKIIRTTSAWSTKMKVVHPWLGALDSRQWIVLLAMHQKLHKRQIEAILATYPPDE